VRWRPLGALLLAAVGVAALCYGLFAHWLGTAKVLLSMGVGTLLVFFGVALFAAKLVRPLVRAVGPVGTWTIAVFAALAYPVAILLWPLRAGVAAVRAFEQELLRLPGVREVTLRGYEGENRAMFDVQLSPLNA